MDDLLANPWIGGPLAIVLGAWVMLAFGTQLWISWRGPRFGDPPRRGGLLLLLLALPVLLWTAQAGAEPERGGWNIVFWLQMLFIAMLTLAGAVAIWLGVMTLTA